MQTLNQIKLLGLSALSLGFIHAASANIVMQSPDAGVGSFEITSDITFDVTATGTVSYFVFDEWVSSNDGTVTSASASPGMSIDLNDETGSFYTAQVRDNNAATLGDITPNDGYISLSGSGIEVISGNTITLKAGVYSLKKNTAFNPLTTQTFTGDMFLTDNLGVRLSGNTPVGIAPVPEPTTYALLGIGAIALGLSRRRFSKA